MKVLDGIFRPTDVVIKMNNLDGVSGLRCLLGAALIINTGTFSPSRYLELVERFKATFASISTY